MRSRRGKADSSFDSRSGDNKRSKESGSERDAFLRKSERRMKVEVLDDIRRRRLVFLVHVHRGAKEGALYGEHVN